jgi:hypothetical protein
LKERFQKFDALKGCVKIVMALAIFAAGLLLIRLCGEHRLQRILNITLLEKRYSNPTMAPEKPSSLMVSKNYSQEE